MLFAPGLGELAGDGGGEDGLAVALELGFGVAQGGDAGVEAGEEFLDPGDDAVLFGEGWEGDLDIANDPLTNVRLRSARALFYELWSVLE